MPTLYGPSIPRSILLVSRACTPVFPTVFPAERATRGGGRSITLASAGGLRVFENDSVSLRYLLTPSRACIASGITDVTYMDISTLFGAVSECTQTSCRAVDFKRISVLSAAVHAIDYGLCGVCIRMVDKISSAPREKMMRGFGGSLGSVHRMRLYCTIMDEN